jgi:hypothetical protein
LNNLQILINQINIRNNFLMRVWKGTRKHIHGELLAFFWSEWFILLYWLTKYFKKLSYFYPSWTLQFSSCDLGGDWCLGVGLYFYVKWKTCNVTKLINIICMQKKKRYIEYGFALQRVAMIVTWCFIIPIREFIFISVNL